MSLKISNNKIYNYEYEIKKLYEELRLRDVEIQKMNMKFKNMLEEPRYHLAFLFASPLIRKMNSSISTLSQLDYQTEIKNIENHLKDVKYEIRYKVDVATPSNFRSVIQDAPFAIHFSGHGMRNNKESLGNYYELVKDKGDILLLEDESGIAEYLFEKDLKKLIELSKSGKELSHHYEVVFVSS